MLTCHVLMLCALKRSYMCTCVQVVGAPGLHLVGEQLLCYWDVCHNDTSHNSDPSQHQRQGLRPALLVSDASLPHRWVQLMVLVG